MDDRAILRQDCIYIDETKRQRYIVVATRVSPAASEAYRQLLHDLALPGERSIHMNNERPERRQLIATAIAESAPPTTVYDAGRNGTEKARRRACLTAIVRAAGDRPTHFVLDRDDSLVRWDREQLVSLTRAAGRRQSLSYEHGKAKESHPLLALPDIVAWCWARGGEWRSLVRPFVERVESLEG